LTTQTQEPSKPKSAYVDDAVQLAVDARWEEAVELNEFIIQSFGADEGSQNRLGKALTELGRLEEAKAAYDAALAINPMNPVARKNASKLESLMNAKDILKGGPVKVDLNLFVEEMGKTTTTTCGLPPRTSAPASRQATSPSFASTATASRWTPSAACGWAAWSRSWPAASSSSSRAATGTRRGSRPAMAAPSR